MQLRWCNTKQMLADGLTKTLVPPLALMALMSAKQYAVPAGRVGKGVLRPALIAAQIQYAASHTMDTLAAWLDSG